MPSPEECFQVKSGERTLKGKMGNSWDLFQCVSLTQTWVKARYGLVTHPHLDAVCVKCFHFRIMEANRKAFTQTVEFNSLQQKVTYPQAQL